jgi:hypothetical protein
LIKVSTIASFVMYQMNGVLCQVQGRLLKNASFCEITCQNKSCTLLITEHSSEVFYACIFGVW